MARNRGYLVVPVLLTLIAGLSGVLSNVVSGTLPETWQPYLWLSWPLFAVLMLITIGLVVWQALLEKVPPPPSPVTQIPHNLPPRSEFIGRETEKARVHEALQSRSHLVSIDGIGGIGKTVLALEVAHECLRASKGEEPTDGIATFGGFIWTTAKDRNLTLNALLDTVARTLDHPGIAQQPLEEKRIAVEKLLQQKPYLLIMDNFETITDDSAQDFLTELPEPSKALLTTREQKVSQVWAVSLKELAESEARTLMRSEGKRLGLESLERAGDRILSGLCQATGGAPLAIKWAVGQMKQRGQSLDTVLAALHEARGSIFDNVFTRSWNLLSTSARQVLIVMPLFAASASREGIEAVSGLHHFALDEALGQLVEMSLLDATDEELTRLRYSIHPLTRAYAGSRFRETLPRSEQDAVCRRMVLHFCEYVWEHREDAEDNFDRLEEDLPNILAAFDFANQQNAWEQVRQLLDGISDFLDRRGYWDVRVRLSQSAMAAAKESGKYEEQGWIIIYHQGWTLLLQERYEEARRLIERGLKIAQEKSFPIQAALALRNLGVIALEEEQYLEARRKCEDSIRWWEKAGQEEPEMNPQRGRAMTLGTLGNIAWELEEYDRAYRHYLSQKEAYWQLKDSDGLSVAYASLARCAVHLGRPIEAVRFCRNALEAFREAERTDGPGYMLCLQQTQREGSYPGRRQMLLDRSVSFEQYGRSPVAVYFHYSLRAIIHKLTGSDKT